VNSIDTNILLYGMNQDCKENKPAFELLQTAMEHPENWIISDQVYFELYSLVRNPAVLEKPLDGNSAFELIDYYRNKIGWLHCSYHTSFWDDMAPFLMNNQFSSKKVFDMRLAVALKHNNIDIFYTRNIRDFKELHWFEVINPID